MGSLAVVGGLAACALLAGCSLVVGSLDECKTSADCAKKGSGLACVDSLCVSSTTSDAGQVPDAGPAVLRDARCQDVFGNADAGSVIRFGAVIPKTTATGAVDPRGVLREDALELAVNQINTTSAIQGHTLVLRVCDDTGDANLAGAQAQELLDEGAMALVSNGSSETIAMTAPAVNADAVVMSISATSTQIAAAGVLPDGGAKRVWSTATSDALQGKVLANILRFIYALDPARAAPVCVYSSDIAFNGLYDTIKDDLLASTDGGIFLKPFTYTDASGIASTVNHAKATAPGAAVVIVPIGDIPSFFGAWTPATGTPDPAWLFTDNSRNAALVDFDGGIDRLAATYPDGGGAFTQGTGPSTAAPTSTAYLTFKSAFEGVFVDDAGVSVDPGSASYVPNAYDSVLLLAAGAVYADVHGGISGAGIAQGLGQLYDGPDDGGGSGVIPLQAGNFTLLRAAFAQGHKVNVAGASGALDFDPVTGTAPGAIDTWKVASDGGIVTTGQVNP